MLSSAPHSALSADRLEACKNAEIVRVTSLTLRSFARLYIRAASTIVNIGTSSSRLYIRSLGLVSWSVGGAYAFTGGAYPFIGSDFVVCWRLICAHWWCISVHRFWFRPQGLHICSLGLVLWSEGVHMRPLGVYIRSLGLVSWSVGVHVLPRGLHICSLGLVSCVGGGYIPVAGLVLHSRRKPFGFVVRSGSRKAYGRGFPFSVPQGV